ncbi:50S ribosomal protein L11 methyltransferase [Amaricoccus macauensis]|uniref:50S ribosomal protein L11 methyltransferase n=1 Tax=Amaricoccus macauensis TaxID=57001 RepID=UPI003C798150
MTLYHAITEVGSKAAAQAIFDALDEVYPAPKASGTHDRDDGTGIWEVGAYFDGRPDETMLAIIATMHGAKEFSVAPVGTKDWMAQVRAGLTPVRAGRFIVYGSHDRESVPSNLIGLEIEAALAFGTGHHATTQGCLIAFDKLLRQGYWPKRIADIGGGTGVLAMAAARSCAADIIASDIDALATETAKANARANRLNGRIRCVTAAGFQHSELRARAPYDLILSNILAGPLKRLAPQMVRHTNPGSVLILSGILARQAASVEAVYRGWGFSRRDILRRGEWVALTLQR